MASVPSFARIEARITSRDDIAEIASEIDALAIRLRAIDRDRQNSDEAAILLAYDRIKSTSQKLRKGGTP